MIIAIIGEKGGTGKSTIATNLAVQLARQGIDVMLLDADPQGTASKWADRRNESVELLPVVHCTQKTGDIYKTAIDLAKRYTHVIIDAGGRDSKELRTGIVAADKIYIPVKASQADIETLPHLNELVGLAKSMNPTVQAMSIVSMASTQAHGKELPDALEALQGFENISPSLCTIFERKAYRDALLAGKGAVEMDNDKAIVEIQALYLEVFNVSI